MKQPRRLRQHEPKRAKPLWSVVPALVVGPSAARVSQPMRSGSQAGSGAARIGGARLAGPTGSEPESFSGVSEQRAKTRPI